MSMLLDIKIKTAKIFKPLVDPCRFKGAKGGRGSGKSTFFGELLIDQTLDNHIRAVCAREVQNSIKDSSKQLIEDKIRALGIESLFKITEREIQGPNDSLYVFKGLLGHTVSSVKSLEGFNRLFIDEAQSVSQKSLDLAIPTFRTPGSEIWCSWNPNLETDPIDKFFEDNKDDPNFCLVHANYYDNPWFPYELRMDMERDKLRDPEKYRHVWLGDYQRNSEARVFKNWTIETFERPRGTIFRQGLDFGFAIDPTAFVRCSIDGNALYIDYEAVMVGCEIVNTPDLLRQIPDSDKWFITADSARPETISHLKKNGYPKITYAKKGAGSVDEGIEFLKSFDIIVHPRCVETIKELTLYSYKVDKLTGAITPYLEDKHNHCVDACRYACEGARRIRIPKDRQSQIHIPSGAWA
jgi:phage terminase large subunit